MNVDTYELLSGLPLPSKRQCFEYLVRRFNFPEDSLGKGMETFQCELNAYGKSGWRLIASSEIVTGFMLVFERCVTNERS